MGKIIIISLLLFILLGCARDSQVEVTTPVVSGNPYINETLGQGKTAFQVYGSATVSQLLSKESLSRAESAEGRMMLNRLASGAVFSEPGASTARGEGNLTVAFPEDLLGQQQVMGAVITAVSDTKSADLGGLKLTDLTPLHVQPKVLKKQGGGFVLGLMGCNDKCAEGSDQGVLLAIPITAMDSANKRIVLDLAGLGDELNLIQKLDPDGQGLQLKTKSSKTIAVDYSLSTLVFDVEVTMVPLSGEENKETVFTVRWYLKLASAFSPAFQPRDATEGLGFFMTERVIKPKIERQPLGNIHYFIKNVPEPYKKAFASGFDEWNEKFTALLGKKVLSYEFVDSTDSRSALLVPGDPRYHIMEWDLVNEASYGGLGPSQANQFTGEIFGSNVLIQGPRIIKIYTEWFKSAAIINELRVAGLDDEADILAQKFAETLRAFEGQKKPKMTLDLGGRLAFNMNSQRPPLEDPIMQREDFDMVPANYSFQSYMDGYFHDMVAHELGHNLGLRHNFRGNLFSEAILGQGKVSISVMEYLGRGFRYLDQVGSYDVMALKYGYLGVAPERRDQFCTDEEVPNVNQATLSAECSRDDATPDAFLFFERRLIRATDLLYGRGQSKAPAWTIDDMKRELAAVLPGMGFYATSAESTGAKWVTFFNGGDRPKFPSEVKGYVINKIKTISCASDFASILAAKESEAAKAKVIANREALKRKVLELLKPLKIVDNFDC